MRRLLSFFSIILLLSFFPHTGSAQSFSFETKSDTTYCYNFNDVVHVWADIQCLVDDSISLDIIRTGFTGRPDWINGICAGDNCYAAIIDSVRIKIGGQEKIPFRSGFQLWNENTNIEIPKASFKLINPEDKQNAITFNTYCVYTASITSSTKDQIDQYPISVYPNPSSNYITIDSELKVISSELYDMNGRLCKTNMDEVNLDLSKLNPGVYLLKIKTAAGVIVRKIFKH